MVTVSDLHIYSYSVY